MSPKERRRPGQGAAPDTNVAIGNSNASNIGDPGTGPQPSSMQSFWTAAGEVITCTLIRRSDRPWRLTALAAGDETMSAFWRALRDWMLHALEHRPICLSCPVTFSRRSLPTDWAMLSPFWGRPGTVMLSGICDRCSCKSDAELMAAALRDLQKMNPNIRRVELAGEASRA
jgi:hypothetical protein